MRHLVLAACAALAFVPGHATSKPAVVVAEATLQFEKIAKEAAASYGVDATDPAKASIELALQKGFVHARLGAFDVHFPVKGLEKHADDFKASCGAVLDAQEKWLDWLQANGKDTKSVREDVKALTKWVAAWNVPTLSKAKDPAGRDVAEFGSTSDAVRQASARFAEVMQKGSLLGAPREDARPLRLLLTPTRKDFCELVFFAGWVDAKWRASYWLDTAPDWTQCFIDQDQIVALQYGVAGRKADDYTSGVGMNEADANVMQQQVAQLAANSLLRATYEDRAPNHFLLGLGINLVIDVFGEVNTRVDGDTRSKVTQKREVFVPGGNSDGGFLPKNSAGSRWREKNGGDHFIPTLRAAQKEGEEALPKEKNKAACFAVHDDSDGKRFGVKAPILGPGGTVESAIPAEFQGDFREFLRAYQSAFIHWLQTEAVKGAEKPSRERFAQLLKKLADPNLTSDFLAVFEELYDKAPITNEAADKNCLEGQFLIWLSKQK